MSLQLHQAPARGQTRPRASTPQRSLRVGTTAARYRHATEPAASELVANLVARSASGDAQAWDELVDRFAPLVWGIARAHRLCDADAEDVFQATWLLLLEHIDRLTQPGRLAGWLATTTRREALRVIERSARTLPIDEERIVLSSDGDDAPALVLTCERDAAIRTAFATLPARDQTLLTLLVAEPRQSYEQIAVTLGMPIGSIGPTRSRCLERLRRALLAAGLELAG